MIFFISYTNSFNNLLFKIYSKYITGLNLKVVGKRYLSNLDVKLICIMAIMTNQSLIIIVIYTSEKKTIKGLAEMWCYHKMIFNNEREEVLTE